MKKNEDGPVVVTRPSIERFKLRIVGTAPYVQHKFSAKARAALRGKQEEGSAGKSKKSRAPRDFSGEFDAASHKMADGAYGIPASALRSAMISACRLCGVVMKAAKLAVFVEADGFDTETGDGLVRIKGTPEPHEAYVRIQMTTSVVVRPMWREWSAIVTIAFDADHISKESVVNLLARAGMQCGIGEGRHDSRMSNGCGWGTFRVEQA